MIPSLSIEPVVGEWYESHGQRFEVVALDDAEQVIEIQHADGDLEEIEAVDWLTRCRAGSLRTAGQPEDAQVATDSDEGDEPVFMPAAMEEVQGLHASPLEDIDLFASND